MDALPTTPSSKIAKNKNKPSHTAASTHTGRMALPKNASVTSKILPALNSYMPHTDGPKLPQPISGHMVSDTPPLLPTPLSIPPLESLPLNVSPK
eukprot:CAMPEP_0202471402 /NCGR_PEP_ID=MMETSP1360-20130828/84592_1 /ASSEMBLY_ACC=CAM_ASM_000848 /TAXON_ID=515479 /ORGANISM="Licmophora paradoxa, Strain CCMP2313" /LENGTH=94 /DNA_ID=CAMNT_0049097479 /DNA_START=101 /DNA_END=385 /DNA_ORIENTATION=-